MSESMNKYHKCMSELGRSMSGWVKLGAIAVGVGVGMGGVPVPGGGVSKAWAERYAFRAVCHDGSLVVSVENLTTGAMDAFHFTRQQDGVVFVSPDCHMGVVSNFKQKGCDFSFKIGGLFVEYSVVKNLFCLRGEAKDDSFLIEVPSSKLTVLSGDNLEADVLVFKSLQKGSGLDGVISCRALCLLQCEKYLVAKYANLQARYILSKASFIQNHRRIICDRFIGYDQQDCGVLSGQDSPEAELQITGKSQDCLVFKGLNSDDSTFANSVSLGGFGIPNLPGDELSLVNIRESAVNYKESLTRRLQRGSYTCIFMACVRFSSGCATDFEFLVSDANNKVLGDVRQKVADGWNEIATLLNIKIEEANTDVVFHFSSGEKCRRRFIFNPKEGPFVVIIPVL